jgi:hypothetical protein
MTIENVIRRMQDLIEQGPDDEGRVRVDINDLRHLIKLALRDEEERHDD